MLSRTFRLLAAFSVVVALVGFSVLAMQKKTVKIGIGPWGGQHIHLDIEAKTATIEFDCAHGTIKGPLVTDAKGNFSLKGTYAPERRGPVRSDDAAAAEQAAVYSGSVQGQTMTLSMRLEGQDSPLETFTLTQGKTGKIRKCM